jgi:hypothetical protein
MNYRETTPNNPESNQDNGITINEDSLILRGLKVVRNSTWGVFDRARNDFADLVREDLFPSKTHINTDQGETYDPFDDTGQHRHVRVIHPGEHIDEQ